MSKEETISVGDRFLIEVEIRTLAKNAFGVEVRGDDGAFGAFLHPDFLLSGKRLPRALKVGDKTTYTGVDHRLRVQGPWAITAIYGEWAWCHGPSSDSGELIPLSALTLASGGQS